MRVCCNTDNGGYIIRDGEKIFLDDIGDIHEYYNLPAYKEIRAQMLLGERPLVCSKCYEAEDQGGTSIRQSFIQEYAESEEFLKHFASTHPDGHLDELRIEYFDVALSNSCNIKCMMCSPVNSDQLIADFDALNIPYNKERVALASSWGLSIDPLLAAWDKMLPSLQKCLITGGEPLINKLHLSLLDRAVETGDASHITLMYHSNLMKLPERVLERWKQFKHVDLHVSLEGFSELNDYIRYGSVWGRIVENIHRLLALRDQGEISLSIEFHTVFQASNCLGLTDLFKFLMTLPGVPALPYPIWLDHPSWHMVENLPREIKLEAMDRLERFWTDNQQQLSWGRFANWNQEKYQMVHSHMERALAAKGYQDRFQRWQQELHDFQLLRGNSLGEILPEMRQFNL